MKTIQVKYFALLREQRGQSSDSLETEADTPAALYEELRARHGFTLAAGQLRVAVNESFQDWSTTLNNGDTVVFVPPVAGG